MQGVGGAKYSHVRTVVRVVLSGRAGGFLATDFQVVKVPGPGRSLTRLPQPRTVVFDLPGDGQTRNSVLHGAGRNMCGPTTRCSWRRR